MAFFTRRERLRACMMRLSYDTAEALVYDPVAPNRMATRAVLYTLGFRKIETVPTAKVFADYLRRRPPDLAMCEMQGADAELCATIQALRQDGEGHNPFIVIIATAWEKNAALIARVVNSGADDLLLRPFSTALLGSRIETHIQRRKGFVVTTDYVGPDRRRDQARPSNAELFDAPNSLKMKARDRLTAEETAQRLDLELRAAREVLNSEKMRRDAFQACIQWRLMQEKIAGRGTAEEELRKIAGLAGAIAKRARDADFDQAVGWCDSILAAVEGLELGVDRNASMHLLGHAALSLNQLFRPDSSPDESLNEIDATMALIRAREAEKLAS
jgi:DNA-binding response OmpR family regulator